MRTRLTERDLTRIVRRVIKEQDEKDDYSDLYGKTVTYKDKNTGVIVRGIIKGMTYAEPDGIIISHNKIYVTNPEETGYVMGNYGTDTSVSYDCDDKTFYISLKKYIKNDNPMVVQDKNYEGRIRVTTFTCNGLSDILSQRYPCATDFSMKGDFNIPNNLA
jgi:hypothetical protein